MNYSYKDVMEFIDQEDVKFIRLAFTDAYGNQKNIAIQPDELDRAFTEGISFDASAVAGFTSVVKSDLFLFPIPSTLTILPWRSFHGKVVRMFCDIRYPNGKPYEKDSRALLKKAVQDARDMGLSINLGSDFEFYLFKTDDTGNNTMIPFDEAGYLDVAPADKGENVRREICLTMHEMGIFPESSHHEEGPGQNEIDFRRSDPLTAADNALNFVTVVNAIAQQNGLWADFSPKPLPDQWGNGLHINISVTSNDGRDYFNQFLAGVLAHAREMTAFLNPCEASYKRLGEHKAPNYVSWSPENRSQYVRIPAPKGGIKRMELRSPDPTTNPYVAFALIIQAGLDGIRKDMTLQEPSNIDLYTATADETAGLEKLPASLMEAHDAAKKSAFIASVLPVEFIDCIKL